MFSSHTHKADVSSQGLWIVPYKQTPIGLETVRRDHPAAPGGDGVFLNPRAGGASRLPLVATPCCLVSGAKLRAPAALTAA